MKIRLATQISVFLKNQPGVMADISTKLAKKKVNILGISIDESSEWGVFRMIVDDVTRAKIALHGYGKKAVMVSKVLEVILPNEPGQLLKISSMLGKGGVNVNYAYASGKGDETILFLSVDDVKKALKILV